MATHHWRVRDKRTVTIRGRLPKSLSGHLVQAGLVTSVVERAPEHVTFALADLDPFLQCRRSPSLVNDLPDDAHRALLVGRPEHVAQRVDLGFAQRLLRAISEFAPKSQLDSLCCRSRFALFVPTSTCEANRLTSRSTTGLMPFSPGRRPPRFRPKPLNRLGCRERRIRDFDSARRSDTNSARRSIAYRSVSRATQSLGLSGAPANYTTSAPLPDGPRRAWRELRGERRNCGTAAQPSPNATPFRFGWSVAVRAQR